MNPHSSIVSALVVIAVTSTGCGAISAKLGSQNARKGQPAASEDPAGKVATSDPSATAVSGSADDRPRDATGDEHRAYHELIREHRHTFQVIARAKAGETPIHPDPAKADAQLTELEAKLAALETFADACDRFRGLRIMDLQPHTEPDVACDAAKSRDGLVATLAVRVAKAHVASSGKSWRFMIKTLEKGHGLSNKQLRAIASFDAAAERERVGTAIEPLLARSDERIDLEALIPDLGSELDQALREAPAASLKFRYRNKTRGPITRETKRPFVSMKRFRILRTLARGDWLIRKHRSGVPSFREQRTQVVGKLAGEAFCRLYEVELRQTYAGGGRWQRAIRSGVVGQIRVTSCK